MKRNQLKQIVHQPEPVVARRSEIHVKQDLRLPFPVYKQVARPSETVVSMHTMVDWSPFHWRAPLLPLHFNRIWLALGYINIRNKEQNFLIKGEIIYGIVARQHLESETRTPWRHWNCFAPWMDIQGHTLSGVREGTGISMIPATSGFLEVQHGITRMYELRSVHTLHKWKR